MGLEELGITNEQLLEIVANKLCDQFTDHDSWEDDYWHSRVEAAVADRMAEKVDAVFTETISPRVDAIIDQMVMRKTSAWGEVKGETQTMREYISGRIDSWLTEKVNSSGEPEGYSRDKTRIGWLVDKHLGRSVEFAVRDAMMASQSGMADILNEHVKGHIVDIAKKFTIAIRR